MFFYILVVSNMLLWLQSWRIHVWQWAAALWTVRTHMPPSKICLACHLVLRRAATWRWRLQCLVKDPTLKSAHRLWHPPICHAEVVILKEIEYCSVMWECWQHDGFEVLSGKAFKICLFTVFQNTVPLAMLWNRNLRIIMICQSTATFLGIMICPQCGDHPLIATKTAPLISLKTLVLH